MERLMLDTFKRLIVKINGREIIDFHTDTLTVSYEILSNYKKDKAGLYSSYSNCNRWLENNSTDLDVVITCLICDILLNLK